MTPTSGSTAAGTERRSALAGWLRRAAGSALASDWVLRGSLVTAAVCPDARPPVDVDYLLPGTAGSFDPEAITAAVRAIATTPDLPPVGGPPIALAVQDCEVIFGDTASPGLRARLVTDGGVELQVDLAVGDPMAVPPRPVWIADVGPVLACAPETLFGWKLHGLCEYGPGRWRAKDLFDLDLLWRTAGLDLAATRAAIQLAFSSRNLSIDALDDFRLRASWGGSRGGRRKWRALQEAHPAADDFAATCARLRAAVDQLLGSAEPPA